MKSLGCPRVAIAIITGCVAVACSAPGPQGEVSDWVGSITTQGDVTAVINESGSVWGGTATLVEEASIGSDTGASEYLFGRVIGLAATDDRIYVLDRTVPVVRVFDYRGNHLFDIGREGQGPGEFHDPNELALDPKGRIFVRSVPQIAVFSLDGDVIARWPQEGGVIMPMRVAADGTLFTPASRRQLGYQSIRPDGTKDDFFVEPDVERVTQRIIAGMGIESVGGALFPRGMAAFAPFGAWIVGVPTEYRFEIRYLDGKVTEISRAAKPVAIDAEESDWYRRAIAVLQQDPQRRAAPLASDTPSSKPAFEHISVDLESRIWLRRLLGVENLNPDCAQNPVSVDDVFLRPCFRQVWGLDGFEESGRFLGTIELPAEVRFSYALDPFFWRDGMFAVAEDENGTIMVKRYRLVLPGEE